MSANPAQDAYEAEWTANSEYFTALGMEARKDAWSSHELVDRLVELKAAEEEFEEFLRWFYLGEHRVPMRAIVPRVDGDNETRTR